MERPLLISRCAQGFPIRFRWFGNPTSLVGLDIETVLFRFDEIVNTKGKKFHENSLLIARAEIRNRLERACAGKLRSTHHIRWVDKQNLPPMFELRWQGITLSSTDGSGAKKFQTLLIRMYYSEPGSNPRFFIGHHIHEKKIGDPERTKILQNIEIQVARELCQEGQITNWGIPLDVDRNIL